MLHAFVKCLSMVRQSPIEQALFGEVRRMTDASWRLNTVGIHMFWYIHIFFLAGARWMAPPCGFHRSRACSPPESRTFSVGGDLCLFLDTELLKRCHTIVNILP